MVDFILRVPEIRSESSALAIPGCQGTIGEYFAGNLSAITSHGFRKAAGTAKTSFVSLHLEEFEREGTQGPEEIKDLKTATLLLNQGKSTVDCVCMSRLSNGVSPISRC